MCGCKGCEPNTKLVSDAIPAVLPMADLLALFCRIFAFVLLFGDKSGGVCGNRARIWRDIWSCVHALLYLKQFVSGLTHTLALCVNGLAECMTND